MKSLSYIGKLMNVVLTKEIGMSNDHPQRRTRETRRAERWPEKMKLSLAHKFLKVSHAKLTSLIKAGVIPYERDPLDHRVKLIRKADLEKLKRDRE